MKFSIFRVRELYESHLVEALPEQSGGWERIWSAGTGENVIQISAEKKLEVDEAERYRKPIREGKNPSVGTHQFRDVTCVEIKWEWFLTDHSFQLFFMISTPPPSDFNTAILFFLFVLTILVKNLETGTSLVAQWFKSACQCRGHRFDPWSRKIPHAAEQLSPCAGTTEPVL